MQTCFRRGITYQNKHFINVSYDSNTVAVLIGKVGNLQVDYSTTVTFASLIRSKQTTKSHAHHVTTKSHAHHVTTHSPTHNDYSELISVARPSHCRDLRASRDITKP